MIGLGYSTVKAGTHHDKYRTHPKFVGSFLPKRYTFLRLLGFLYDSIMVILTDIPSSGVIH